MIAPQATAPLIGKKALPMVLDAMPSMFRRRPSILSQARIFGPCHRAGRNKSYGVAPRPEIAAWTARKIDLLKRRDIRKARPSILVN
jgi:hypothetical protein